MSVIPSGKQRPVRQRGPFSHIAVGVDGYPEGRDAVTLGAALARVSSADMLLVMVHSPSIMPAVPGLDWKTARRDAELALRTVRDAHAPNARTGTEVDLSTARALHRAARRNHCDLLVVGSSRQAADEHVRIGKRTRQLLCNFDCALAVAPRGLHRRPELRVERIGVGYDESPESERALALAGSIAIAAGAQLDVRAVIDDRVPVALRSALGGLVATQWKEAVQSEEERLSASALAAAQATRARCGVEVVRGRPADALLDFSAEIDLLVIGSRRWGPAARVLLGTTGEALLHDAACPVLTVPRPGDVASPRR